MLLFKRIELGDKARFEGYTLCHGYHNLEASFANIYLWGKAWNIQMATDEDAMYLALDNDKGKFFMLPPFLKDCRTSFSGPLEKCETVMRDKGAPLHLKGVTNEIKQKIEMDCPGMYTFSADRANFEYVYLSKDLSALEGKKYHGKRNHINRLLKDHSFTYRRYTESDYNNCVTLHEAWIEGKGRAERRI